MVSFLQYSGCAKLTISTIILRRTLRFRSISSFNNQNSFSYGKRYNYYRARRAILARTTALFYLYHFIGFECSCDLESDYPVPFL